MSRHSLQPRRGVGVGQRHILRSARKLLPGSIHSASARIILRIIAAIKTNLVQAVPAVLATAEKERFLPAGHDRKVANCYHWVVRTRGMKGVLALRNTPCAIDASGVGKVVINACGHPPIMVGWSRTVH